MDIVCRGRLSRWFQQCAHPPFTRAKSRKNSSRDHTQSIAGTSEVIAWSGAEAGSKDKESTAVAFPAHDVVLTLKFDIFLYQTPHTLNIPPEKRDRNERRRRHLRREMQRTRGIGDEKRGAMPPKLIADETWCRFISLELIQAVKTLIV